MKKVILMIACAVITSSVFCGNASAEGEHIHDGFFLRLAPGLGAMSASETIGNNKLEVSGASGLFNFGLGGAIAENLILHLDVASVSTSDPTVKVNGASATVYGDASTTLMGIGLTSYFASNAYLTGSIGIAKSKFESNGVTGETDNGYGINLMIGKEWWVSDNWGLGVAGQLLYTSCPDPSGLGTTSDYKTTSLGILFSATYN